MNPRLLLVIAACACGGATPATEPCLVTDGGVPSPVSFSRHVQPVFDLHCARCHTEVHDVDFTLAPGHSYAALVNDPASPACNGGMMRVKPGDPQNSMLWLKLSADPRRCLAAMPRGSAGLKQICPSDFARVEAWITEGAPDD